MDKTENIVIESVDHILLSQQIVEQQEQQLQELTEQVEQLQERYSDVNRLLGLSVFTFFLVLLLFYAVGLIYDLLLNHKKAIEKLQSSTIKLKRKKLNKVDNSQKE